MLYCQNCQVISLVFQIKIDMMEPIDPEPAPDIEHLNIKKIYDIKEQQIIRDGVYVAQVKKKEDIDITQIVEAVRNTDEPRYF